MILSLSIIYFEIRHNIPPQLLIKADHTGIMRLQLKGGGWVPETGRRYTPELQGHAGGGILPVQIIVQGSTKRALLSLRFEYNASLVPPAAGGKKKEREAAAAGSSDPKLTSSFVPDYRRVDAATHAKFAGVGAHSHT